MTRPDRETIHAALRAKGYTLFESPKGYDLNIAAVRSANPVPGTFDDWLTVSWRAGADWQYLAFPVTTDPGQHYLDHPVHPKGTATLIPGQYRSSHHIAKHKGRYDALCQRPGTALPVWRRGVRHDDGTGLNLHRAAASGTTHTVGRWSAGCTVFANADDFALFMGVCRIAARVWGNAFSYTLLEEGAL